MYINVGLIVLGGSELHNFKIFRAWYQKLKIGRKSSVAKIPADAHNSNSNNINNNSNNNKSNNNNNNNNNKPGVKKCTTGLVTYLENYWW